LAIRKWADNYIKFRSIPKHQQGAYNERLSVLSDPDIKERAISWLKNQKAIYRSISAPHNELQGHILPECLGIQPLNQVT
ncbi:hypothetical protein K501DRAFT_203122, partial [Backusella circina FSU 941]